MRARVKYHIIYRHREEYPISVMCAFFAVSRSGYYAFVHRLDRPEKDAALAENIAQQLENRISFRRAMKSTMQRTMKSGAKGIKTSVSGRLGGADMARTEFYSDGTIPLQTLRADIDYGFAEADTTYGKVGVKAWIYNGEILPTKGTKEGSDK